jgi:hypothetical protein
MLSNAILHSTYNILPQLKFVYADPSGRAFKDVGLRPLTCWDCDFESCRGHGYLSVVSVVCCQVEVSVTGRSPVQRSPTECVCVCVCVCVSVSLIKCNRKLLHLQWEDRTRSRIRQKQTKLTKPKQNRNSVFCDKYATILHHLRNTSATLQFDLGKCSCFLQLYRVP